MFCDKKVVINIAHNSIQHDRTKHIEIDRHFIKEKVVGGSLCLYHVSFGNQVADIFTKELYNKSFLNLIYKLGM